MFSKNKVQSICQIETNFRNIEKSVIEDQIIVVVLLPVWQVMLVL